MFCPSQFKETRVLVAVPELHSQGRRGSGFSFVLKRLEVPADRLFSYF